MAHAKRELLPVGKKIDHDGSSLEIVKRLKAGLTGEVYEGNLFLSDKNSPVHVAVKAMKTLEFPVARQFFLQESETLAFLMHLEEEANREQGLSLKIAPTYYGRGEYQETPYLVMEFIDGVEIPNLLIDMEDGKFSEQLALIVAWHLYRTLDVLHRLLRKTYIDLKFENLWWVVNAGQLKLTDFGTLEEIQPGDVQRRGVLRDILLAAVYFCKMATGFMPNYSLGELREIRELQKNVKNANISWGTKRELQRLLNRNPAQRPVDANDVAARLRTLVDFWSKDVDKVLEIAWKSLERAQFAHDEANLKEKSISEEGLNYAYRARSAIEIVGLRSPDIDISYDLERLAVILKSANHLERGKNLLRGRSYELAKQVFQEGMEWGDDSATLRRWAYLAEIGEAISPTDFESIQDKAFTMLDESFNKELWEEALDQLKTIKSVLEIHQKNIPIGLTSLLSEVLLFAEIKKAEVSFANGYFQDTADCYRSANTYLGALPGFYQKFIRDIELGDLEKNAREMDAIISRNQRKTSVDAEYDQSIQYVKMGKNEEALVFAERAYRASYAFDYHSERLREAVYAALEMNNYKLAFDVAQIALLCGSIPSKLIVDLTLSKNLCQASQSLLIPDPYQFYESIVGALENAESHLLVKKNINDLLDKAEKKAENLKDADLYLKVGELSEKFGDVKHADDLKAKAEQIHEKKTNEYHVKVDELIAEANILGAFKLNIFENMPQEKWTSYSISDTVLILSKTEERYKYILEIFSYAEKLARLDGYRIDEIIKYKEALGEALSAVTASGLAEAQKKQYEDSLFALNQWWVKIEPLFQWRKRSMEVFENSEASQSIYKLLFSETNDFLTACYAVLQGEKSGKFVEKFNESLADVAQGIRPVASANGVEIRVIIENAHKVLNSLGPDAWGEMKQASESAIKSSEALVSEARKAFEEGDLPHTQSLLDQARSNMSGTQEWKTLYSKTMHVVLWRMLQKDNFEEFSSSQYHPELLKTIRNYAEQNLPVHYWVGSTADAYLKRMDDVLLSHVTVNLAQYRDPTFFDLIREWQEVSWTNKLASSHDMKDLSWNKKEWLDGVYSAVANKNVVVLTSLIHKSLVPEQIETTLSGINKYDWISVISPEENPHGYDAKNQSKPKWVLWIALAVAVFFCGIFALTVFLNREYIGKLISGTYTPKLTFTPSMTPTFELTSTPSPSSTPMLTPTPLTPSIYLVADPKVVYPIIPNSVKSAWIIPPENAKTEPDISDATTWVKEISNDPNAKNEVFYSTQKTVRAFWATDQPLPGGWYAIYVLDTRSKSGGFGSQPYIVSINGEALTPFRGQPSVIFNTMALGQKTDEWLPLGVYEIPVGQKIEVSTEVPALSGNAFFALSRLLIVNITDPQKALYDLLPSERALSALSDDNNALVLNTANLSPLKENYQGQVVVDSSLISWGGSFRTLGVDSLAGVSNKVSILWQFPGRTPAGKYQLMIWIPANTGAVGEFSMLLNSKFLDKQTLPIIAQADHPGQWWPVDIWTLPEEGAVSVMLTVDAKTNAGKAIGIDVVALVKVE